MNTGAQEERPKLKIEQNNIDLDNNNLCCICLSSERDVLLIPCRHIIACLKCVKNLDICPICRATITERI